MAAPIPPGALLAPGRSSAVRLHPGEDDVAGDHEVDHPAFRAQLAARFEEALGLGGLASFVQELAEEGAGGVGTYRQKCDETARNGYPGFSIR